MIKLTGIVKFFTINNGTITYINNNAGTVDYVRGEINLFPVNITSTSIEKELKLKLLQNLMIL